MAGGIASEEVGHNRPELSAGQPRDCDDRFHDDFDLWPEPLSDALDNVVDIAWSKTVERHDFYAEPVQSLLNDLPLAHVRLVDKDSVESNHLSAVRSGHDVFNAPNDLLENGHGATALARLR